MAISLITGGTRSGKTAIALKYAKCAKKPCYIATGWVSEGDIEMEERIRKHKEERGEKWFAIEEQVNLIDAIEEAITKNADFIVVDCLTFWASNLMMNEKLMPQDEVEKLGEYCRTIKIDVVFVTNEVGSGIVPENKLAREFRDVAGLINQEIAKVADNVIVTISGIPLKIKGVVLNADHYL